jgi:uncharacterized protein (TIGR03435 family)
MLMPPARTGTHFVVDDAGVTVAAFASQFTIGGIPVIDHTSLSGSFDIHLEWDESTAPGEPADPAVLSAIRKQLGLQLKSGKGPCEFLVIEHLERPSGN